MARVEVRPLPRPLPLFLRLCRVGLYVLQHVLTRSHVDDWALLLLQQLHWRLVYAQLP